MGSLKRLASCLQYNKFHDAPSGVIIWKIINAVLFPFPAPRGPEKIPQLPFVFETLVLPSLELLLQSAVWFWLHRFHILELLEHKFLTEPCTWSGD